MTDQLTQEKEKFRKALEYLKLGTRPRIEARLAQLREDEGEEAEADMRYWLNRTLAARKVHKANMARLAAEEAHNKTSQLQAIKEQLTDGSPDKETNS